MVVLCLDEFPKNDVYPQAYADDLVVIVSICRPSQLSAAQHTIDLIARWCSLHKLELSLGSVRLWFSSDYTGDSLNRAWICYPRTANQTVRLNYVLGRSQDITDSPVTKSRQDSGRQGTSKQIDHCLYRKMEQGREENPKEPMESDPDSESGGSPTFPKKENTLGRTQEVPPGQEDVTPPPPVSDVLGSLARTIYQLSSATGLSRDVELSRYDGSYEAQSFFDNYDAQADLAQLHYTDRLRRLPNLLQGKALHYFRSLKLDKLYYVDARQALIDLFPETTNASFAQFLAIKLTDRSSLEEYYQKKTVCGLQLNLPHKILLESLTDGLPVADQRIVAAVQPNTLQAWYSVVSRVRGTHSASQVCQQTTRTTPNPSFAPSPRYCGAMHWHAQCPKRPAQSRPRPVYRATTYPQHDRTVLSSPAPFQVNNTRAHVTRSPDPLYTTSPAQAVNPSCPIGTSTTAPKQACSDAQDSTTLLLYQDNVPLPTTLYKFTSCKQHVSHGQVLHQFTPVFATNKYDVPKLKIPPVKINTTSDKEIGGEGFDDFGEHDIEELLVDEALNDYDILESMVDTTKDFETVDSEVEDVTPLDEKLLREGLQLSGKLENIFIQNDNDVERALKFQRDLKFCMSGYRELYKELVKPSQRLITDYLVKEKKITEVPKEALPCRSDDVILSSSDESDLAPIHKRVRTLSDSE
ncbi:hypothetical protein LAZ67_21001339 [Cordylochernes scorpioides]|uniref:Reverse transcriptase domain-containing protein n=1 Tax=Cordylochernes scorpioides TaxID=51811 RepID=A0ABY6LMX9_9ARAC|nr:hypothetical protein LAZ67_21001339 [Cordylochernes scorpioides]